MTNDHSSGPPLRSVFIGSVISSEIALSALYQQRDFVEVNGVFGLAETQSRSVSGYRRLNKLAKNHGALYSDFRSINDPSIVSSIDDLRPDILWVIGLSQLVGPQLRSIPTIGSVGFHPTMLPQGRGRAPIAWIVLGNIPAAATLFLIEEGADSGPILAQVPVATSCEDDAGTALHKVCDAIPAAVSQACSVLRSSRPPWPKQGEARATHLGIRRDVDGVVDWSSSSIHIDRLIKSAARPHPGAWTFMGTTNIRLQTCRVLESDRYWGVPGRILKIGGDDSIVVATGDGAVEILDYEPESAISLKVGLKLGASAQSEILVLRKKVEALERKLDQICRNAGLDRSS